MLLCLKESWTIFSLFFYCYLGSTYNVINIFTSKTSSFRVAVSEVNTHCYDWLTVVYVWQPTSFKVAKAMWFRLKTHKSNSDRAIKTVTRTFVLQHQIWYLASSFSFNLSEIPTSIVVSCFLQSHLLSFGFCSDMRLSLLLFTLSVRIGGRG